MEPSPGIIGRFLHRSGFGKSWYLVEHSLEFTFGFVIQSTGKVCSTFFEKLKIRSRVMNWILFLSLMFSFLVLLPWSEEKGKYKSIFLTNFIISKINLLKSQNAHRESHQMEGLYMNPQTWRLLKKLVVYLERNLFIYWTKCQVENKNYLPHFHTGIIVLQISHLPCYNVTAIK